eukprot:GHVP01050720.1.p1 GENE.GHVP01050720.1~~GHVP01050720.1.p1  ORF type:complete len:177 (-),score=17.91 GHVP01050720.1:94-624(-)
MRKTNNRELLAASGINALLNVFTKLPQAKAEFCDLPVGDHGHNFRLLGNADPKPNGDDPIIDEMEYLANSFADKPKFAGQVQDDQFMNWLDNARPKSGYNSCKHHKFHGLNMIEWFRFDFHDGIILLYEMGFKRLFRGSLSEPFSEITFGEEERNQLYRRMIKKAIQNDSANTVRY